MGGVERDSRDTRIWMQNTTSRNGSSQQPMEFHLSPRLRSKMVQARTRPLTSAPNHSSDRGQIPMAVFGVTGQQQRKFRGHDRQHRYLIGPQLQDDIVNQQITVVCSFQETTPMNMSVSRRVRFAMPWCLVQIRFRINLRLDWCSKERQAVHTPGNPA